MRTKFTDASGNRIGLVVNSTYSQVACPLQFNRADLLDCIYVHWRLDQYSTEHHGCWTVAERQFQPQQDTGH